MNRKPPPVFPSTDPEARNYKSDKFELGTLTNIVLMHDPSCPWCWVGYFHAKKLTEDFGVTFDWRGAELIPPSMEYTPRPPKPADAPPEPPRPPSRFDLFAEAEGIAMPTPRPPFVRTHNALLASEWAWAQGLGAFDAFNEVLYRGYWEHSADIADLNVLGDLAKSAGLVDDIGIEGMVAVRDTVDMTKKYDFASEVLVASVRSPMHVVEAVRAGAQVCTIPFKILEMMYKHPLTTSGIAQFTEDWKKSGLNFD